MTAGIRIVVDDGSVRLEVSAESDAPRRELGAVAWSVLETLALIGHDLDGRWVATTNARDLGRRLGLGKDRAAAALKALRNAGLVVGSASRDAGTARFAASSYEVRLPVSSNVDAPPAALAPSPPKTARTHRRRHASPPDTLPLFPATR